MRLMHKATVAGLSSLLFLFSISSAQAQSTIQISIENNQPANGFFLTPTWFGLHDGNFDYFDAGSAASNSTMILAEDGVLDDMMGGGLINDFSSSQPGGSQGVAFGNAGFGSGAGQPPVIDPGEAASVQLSTMDAATYRYLSFSSMVIPSNDAFIGNDNPLQYEIFDALGNFNGPLEISIFGADVWDAGTEANDGLGAAFSASGGTDTSESLVVRQHPDGLAIFVGTNTAAGTTIGQGFAIGDPIATIRISAVPEPSTAMLLFGGIFMTTAVRRKRN